jgi:hypothetical protein
MKQFGWMLALAMTTVIVSCHKEISTNEQPGNSNELQTEVTTQSAGTSGSCSAPGGLSASNIATTTATLNWSSVSGALVYTVQYKPTSSSTWIVATSGTYGLSVNLYSLSANTTYDWRVYTNCSLTEASGYATSQFSTPGSMPPTISACPGPDDVSTNGSISGAAAINVNTDVKGTIAPVNDIDHYTFTVSSRGTINVWLTTLPANYNLAVFNSSGAQIGISKNKGSKNESVSLMVEAGIYYVKVFPAGNANSAASCYTLRVQTITAT